MTSAPGPQTFRLTRRLRAWNVSSWRHGDRIDATRRALAELAALAARSDGHPRPPVPDVGVSALADQLALISSDAVAAGVRAREIDRVLDELARRLGLSGQDSGSAKASDGGSGLRSGPA